MADIKHPIYQETLLNKARYRKMLDQIEQEAFHARALRESGKAVSDQDTQNLSALNEHRAFAKNEVAQNPLMSIPLAFGVPIDAAAKSLGLRRGRSNAGFWPEVGAGYSGVYEGLKAGASGGQP